MARICSSPVQKLWGIRTGIRKSSKHKASSLVYLRNYTLNTKLVLNCKGQELQQREVFNYLHFMQPVSSTHKKGGRLAEQNCSALIANPKSLIAARTFELFKQMLFNMGLYLTDALTERTKSAGEAAISHVFHQV